MNASIQVKNHFPIVLGLLGSAVFTVLYFRDIQNEGVQNSVGNPVGRIVKTDPEVTRRPFNRLVWLPVENEVPVFEKDTIKTGPQSETTVELNQRGTLTLKPDSLAIIETQNREFKIHLASGDLFLSGEIQAQVGNTTIKGTKGSQFSITRNALSGAVGVASKEGKIVVSNSRGEQKQIEKGQVLKTDEKAVAAEIETFSYLPKFPRPSVPLETYESEKIPVEFEIESMTGAKNEAIEIKVFADQGLKKIIQRKILEPGQLKTQILLPRPATYYWHLTLPNQTKAKSLTSTFSLQKIERPKVIDEKMLQKPVKLALSHVTGDFQKILIQVDQGNDPDLGEAIGLEYSWNDKNYEVLLETVSVGSLKKYQFQTSGEQAIDKGLKIFLKYIYKENKKSLANEIVLDRNYFDYHLYAKNKPELVYPAIGKKWNTTSLKDVSFEWNMESHKIFGPVEYRLVIQPEKSQKWVFSTQRSSFEVKKTFEPGEYVWWVEAYWQKGTEHTISEKREFLVKKPRSITGSELLRAPAFVGE